MFCFFALTKYSSLRLPSADFKVHSLANLNFIIDLIVLAIVSIGNVVDAMSITPVLIISDKTVSLNSKLTE